jgi:homoserine kinase
MSRTDREAVREPSPGFSPWVLYVPSVPYPPCATRGSGSVSAFAHMAATIQIPASTTNFGPGFDCLGAALQIHNRVQIDRDSGWLEPGPQPPIVRAAAKAFFGAAKIDPFAFRTEISGDVPPARGLGSSVTVRLGVLLGLNVLAGSPLVRGQIFQLCSELEGHPDNAAAALYGGFVVVNKAGNQVHRFDVDPSVTFVLLIPDLEVRTSDARAVLPATYSRSEVICNLANSSQIAAAFASRQYEMLKNAFADHLHQPYREQFVPFLKPVVEAGCEAGAYGGFLSGSGSTIACVTSTKAAAVAKAMASAVPSSIRTTTLLVGVDNDGAQIS